jgi:hypothetical protein
MTLLDTAPILSEAEVTWETIKHLDFYLPIPEPEYHGPVWKPNEDGTSFIVPEYTLGWQIIRWVEENLLGDEGEPFVLTGEQKRLLLWWYAIDIRGRFVYRKSVVQRIKGWGKDPFAAVIAAVEFVGPCRFEGWLTKDREDLGLQRGEPLAKPHPRAWIQIAAVSKDQTRNTMKIFPGLFSPECIVEHGIDIGKEIIYAYNGARTIEAVTSSPRALEGGRPTFVIKNETHHWLLNNEGHAMSSVIGRNAAKSKGGTARVMSITNAYEPSEDSVAQREREAWENERDGLSVNTGVLYDSVEASGQAYMRLPRKPDGSFPSDAEVRAYVGAVVDSVRGDAWWLDVEALLGEIFDEANSVSESRRFYYNQIVTADDAWIDSDLAGGSLVHPLARQYRNEVGNDDLRAGWNLVHPDDPIVMFFDGSKSEDSTGLVGCRLDDGYTFLIGVWQRPPGERGKHWLSPREKVDARVIEAAGWPERQKKGRFNVVGFFGDPSHAQDDEDSSRYWDGLMDTWHQRYKDQLQIWATKTGNRQHAIMWDMSSPLHQAEFVAAAERFVGEAETLNDIEEFDPQFQIDGHPALVQHLRNAKRYPTKYGVSLWKGAREGSKKIDLAVCAIGARMVRRMLANVGLEEKEEGPAELWGAWSGQSADQYTEGKW